jgi:hypothetical protein
MKTLVIIVAPMRLADKVGAIKSAIVQYLGTRIVENNSSELSTIVIKETLLEKDKDTISDFVKQVDDKSYVVFIEGEEIPDNEYYFTVNL